MEDQVRFGEYRSPFILSHSPITSSVSALGITDSSIGAHRHHRFSLLPKLFRVSSSLLVPERIVVPMDPGGFFSSA
jgi:hypothetical protein